MKKSVSRTTKFSRKKIRKIILTIIFIIFNIAVIVATAVNEFSGGKNAANLAEVKLDWWMLIPATLCFMAMITLEFWKYVLMTMGSTPRGTFTKREAWKLAWRTVMLGRYYDRITPAAVGGQPAQIMNMRKTGKITSGLATAIPVYSMISGQITFLLIAIPCFLFTNLAAKNPALVATGWIGLLFYAFWPVMVTGTAFFPKITARAINLVVRLLAKLRIVKDEKSAVKKVEKEVEGYTENVKLITKNPKVSISVMLMSLFSNILITLVPYFVLIAFGGDIDFIECFLLTIGVQAAVYFAPTPGNSGIAEGTFYVVFSRLSTGYVFWAMMLWRFFSYYIYVIVGPLIYFAMHLEKKKSELKGGENDHKQ